MGDQRLQVDTLLRVYKEADRTILISPEANHCPFTAKLSFDCTNNVAEYEAYVLGLQAAIEKKIKSLNVYGDSAVVICQLNGEWETRDSKLVHIKNS